ncbi:MAG: hypothetical protein AAGH65_04555 [Pseudomonadota bacterium]
MALSFGFDPNKSSFNILKFGPLFSSLDRIATLDIQPFSIAEYGEGVVISHLGWISFVDRESAVVQQSLPENEAWYRLASNPLTVVGVSPEGLVIRGDLTGRGIPINATHPPTLLMLSLLIFCIAYRHSRLY